MVQQQAHLGLRLGLMVVAVASMVVVAMTVKVQVAVPAI